MEVRIDRNFPRILITGGNGFIGNHLLAYFRNVGLQNVRVAIRSVDKIPPGISMNDTAIVGDISGETDWSHALDGVDQVIHLAGRAHRAGENQEANRERYVEVHVEGTRRLMEAATRANVQKMIYVSSIGAMRSLAGEVLTEESPCSPDTVYGQTKLEAEKIICDKRWNIQHVILRPVLVYGPGNPGNFLRLIRLVNSGLPIPLGGVNNKRSFLYVGNLVDAIYQCMIDPRASGKTFIISDNMDVSTPECIQMIAECLGRGTRLIHVPMFFLKIPFALMKKMGDFDKLCDSFVVSSRQIMSALDWKPPYSFRHGIEQTISWYRNSLND